MHKSSHHVFTVSVISYFFSAARISGSLARYPDSWHCSTDTRKRINLLSHSFHSLFTAQMSLNWKILQAVLWKASNIVHGLMTLAADPSPFMSVKNLPLTSGMVKLDPSNLVFPDFSYSFSLPMAACFSCREESG